MSKYRLYNASFPVDYEKVYEKISCWTGSKYFKLRILRTRDSYFEILFTETKIIEDEFLDINNDMQKIKKLVTSEIIFSIFNKSNNNFLTLNEPRNTSSLRNLLFNIFDKDFFLDPIKINPLELTKEFQSFNSLEIIINKIDIKNALYVKNVVINSVIKADFDVRESLSDLIKTQYYEVSKLSGFILGSPQDKFLVTSDFVLKFEGTLETIIFQFIHSLKDYT